MIDLLWTKTFLYVNICCVHQLNVANVEEYNYVLIQTIQYIHNIKTLLFCS